MAASITRFTLRWEGRDRQIDIDDVSLEQAFVIKNSTACGEAPHGMNLKQWNEGLAEANPLALRALYWLMLQQAGDIRPCVGLDFPVIRFQNAVIEAMNAERERLDALEEDAEPEPEIPTDGESAPSPERASPPTTTRKSTRSGRTG